MKSLVVTGNNVANLPLWFLLALFAVVIICNYLFKIIKPMIIMVLSLAMAMIDNNCNFQVPYYIPNIIIGIAFYSAGYFFSKLQYDKYTRGICVLLYLATIIFFPQYADVRTNTLIYGNYLLWFCSSLAACMTFNNLFKTVPSYLLNLLSKMGKESLIYYVVHWLVISYSTLILKNVFDINEGWRMCCVLILANIILLPLSLKVLNYDKLRFITGK